MDERINEIWNELQNHFSSEVPNPYNYPKCFWYYLQVYKFDKDEGRVNRYNGN